MIEAVERLFSFINRYVTLISFPSVKWTDIIEIFLISYLIYKVLVWVKNTKAWSLLKGIIVILGFVAVAAIFSMTTILWIVRNVFSVAIMAVVVVFQPELRKALEQLGRRRVFFDFFQFDNTKVRGERFSDRTIQELVKASYAMGRERTGALIVLQKDESLADYEKTGIEIDSLISSQLLVNIFEHNTPLHDGAVIIKGDRIASATCYLPLSDNMELSKELGTRHRAGVGISEATDSFTIIVSEETGRVSIASGGELFRNVDADFLTKKLELLQDKQIEENKFRFWKGRAKDETTAN